MTSQAAVRPGARYSEHGWFTRYAWSVVGINLLVILWGAFVRATGSGAGCGNHWPLCNGEIVPRAPAVETLIELSHRITSGLALLAVAGLLIWAYRRYPPSHLVRRAAAASMFFMLTEALIGAGLVLLEYVATNVSVARVYWIAGHLMNTFLLLAALTLTALWASRPVRVRSDGRANRKPAALIGISLLVVLILGAGGAVTALGDTLVLHSGIATDESPLVGQLVALRIYHPLWALLVGIVLLVTIRVVNGQRRDPLVGKLGWAIGGLYGLQLLVGAFNVLWKAPVAVQLIHLLLADLIWIALVLYGAVALAPHTSTRRKAEANADRPMLEQQTLISK